MQEPVHVLVESILFKSPINKSILINYLLSFFFFALMCIDSPRLKA